MLLWCMSTLLSYYGGDVCYAALVHEYFVTLTMVEITKLCCSGA